MIKFFIILFLLVLAFVAVMIFGMASFFKNEMKNLLRRATVITFIITIALMAATVAWAHDSASWIMKGGHRNSAGEWCCGEGDCFVVDSKLVVARQDGYAILSDKIAAAGHESIVLEVVPYSEAQPSGDGLFWRCKRPDGTRRCFFAPPPNT